SWRGSKLRDESTVVLTTWLTVIPVLLLAAFLTKTTDHFSRVVVTAWLISVPTTHILLRFFVRAGLKYLRKSGRNTRRVAIAGAPDSGTRIAQILTASPELGNQVVGIFDDRAAARLAKIDFSEHHVIGRIDDMVAQAK